MSVTLTWNPNKEADLAGYRVYCGQTKGVYTLEKTLPKTQTTVEITDIEPGSTNYFVTTAFDTQANESQFSNEVVYVEPEVIVPVKVVLNWNDVTTYEDGSPLLNCTYDVYRGQQADMSDRSKINSTPLTKSDYEDLNVVDNTIYYYQVRAGASPPSEYSVIVSAGTKKPSQPVGVTATVTVI